MKHPTTAMKHDYGTLRVKGKKYKFASRIEGFSSKTLRRMYIRAMFSKKRLSDTGG